MLIICDEKFETNIKKASMRELKKLAATNKKLKGLYKVLISRNTTNLQKMVWSDLRGHMMLQRSKKSKALKWAKYNG